MDFSAYKDIYVFAEQRDGEIQPVALELISKARELSQVTGEKVVAILAGSGVAEKARTLIPYGADKVIIIEDELLKDYVTEPYTQAVYQAVNVFKPSILMFGATTIGRDLAPRIAARLGTGLTADCTKLAINEETHEFEMTRPAFGGNLKATIKCPEHRPQMSTVRPGVMPKATPDYNREGELVGFAPEFDKSKFVVKLVKTVKAQKASVDITDAKVLVSGGRGVGCKEGFDMLKGLADVLGGEVSSSRAMVDAGIMPHDRQVGQTGKTVRPSVYFALGISGAIQHLAGMEESETIIAINKDKFAPIFSVADLGIVCDLHKVVPLLTERLKKEIAK